MSVKNVRLKLWFKVLMCRKGPNHEIFSSKNSHFPSLHEWAAIRLTLKKIIFRDLIELKVFTSISAIELNNSFQSRSSALIQSKVQLILQMKQENHYN